jgi:hypothetical protein
MATLVYRGVRLDGITTLSYVTEPVMDPTGIDRRCTKVTLTVEGLFSEYGLGTGKPPGFGTEGVAGFPNFGAHGHRLGVTLATLRDHMMAPRGTLEYFVAGVLVLDAPQRVYDTRLPCDVMGGPFPKSFRMAGPVTGDKAAYVQFTVECFISDCDQFLLSNRWRLSDHVDEHFFASLTIQGVATFRKDYLAFAGLQADDWRKHLVYPCEPRMKRASVDVNVSELGDEVQYVVTDRETNYGTGARSAISKIDCHTNSGIDLPYKDIQGLIGQVGGILKAAFTGDVAGATTGLAGFIVSRSFTRCVVQVYGHPGADRFYLARVAHAVAQDRCRGFDVAREITPVTQRLSVDWSSDAPPFVEYQADFLVTLSAGTDALIGNDVRSLVNWDARIGGQPLMALNWDQDTPRARLPGGRTPEDPDGGNVRAENIGRLVCQVLKNGVCQAVGLPPAPGNALKGRLVEGQNTVGTGSETD